jgi:hypothetical protein
MPPLDVYARRGLKSGAVTGKDCSVRQSDLLPDENEIRLGYDQMWAQESIDIMRGSVDIDPILDATTLRWGVSIIVRIPTDVAALFLDIQTTLRNWYTISVLKPM